MNILIKYLSKESLENLVTCLNFRFNKVIFYGNAETIEEERKHTVQCLKKFCQVSEVLFVPVDNENLDDLNQHILQDVVMERGHGNQVYFDTTGGEGLVLVALGYLSVLENVPMHQYDLRKQEVQVLSHVGKDILDSVASQHVDINLERYVLWQGGKINMILHKGTKGISNPDFNNDIRDIFSINARFASKWSYFCIALSKVISAGDKSDHVHIPNLSSIIIKAHVTEKEMCEIFRALAEKQEIMNLQITDNEVEFDFKNDEVKAIFVENGTILELYTYLLESQVSDDCRVGVHLDWDGEIHPYGDVLNEIDVMSLSGYIPNFISCKSGKFDKNALYELDTVARKFGGKYARKQLVCMCDLEKAMLERAKELKIEIIDGRKL